MKLVNISDIHIGKKDDIKLEKELKIFLDYVNDNFKKIDILTISGDLFDRVLTANEYGTVLAINFVKSLLEVTSKNNIPLRIIKGTRSHDFNQLDILKFLSKENKELFRIIEKNEHEEIKGYNVLYLPEEYPTDYDDFYKENLLSVEDNTYDIILGHGMIDFIAFTGYEDDSENRVHGTPTHKADDLIRVTKGPIIFGHIHEKQEYKDKIYYTGSYSRYSFDTPSEKGFMVFDIDDKDHSKFKMEFIENTQAPTYAVLDIDKLNLEGIDDHVKYIKELAESYDFVKIKTGNKANLDIARKLTEKDSSIKVQSVNKEKETIKVDPKYEYILKKELPLNETIQRFMKENHDKEIDLEFISKVISEYDLFENTEEDNESNDVDSTDEDVMGDMDLDL